jgi:phosphoglycolate phosphatase-like HAD superfamily hydrolase
MRLVLFDIDGTLITARGAGRRALRRALEGVFGTAGVLEGYDMSGKTDPRIVQDVLEGAGLARPAVRERLDDFFEAYAQSLAEEIGDGREVVTMPGVAALVRRLDTEADVVLGLLTGNIEQGARIKLGPTGLLPYFALGAFGSDNPDRRGLPSLAARRAHALKGYPFRPDEVMVIGDTPHDIDCARAFGAIAVAVATGRFKRDQLRDERPDLLFDDFSDVDHATRALLSGVGP